MTEAFNVERDARLAGPVVSGEATPWRIFAADTKTGVVYTGPPIPCERFPRASRRINDAGALSFWLPHSRQWSHDNMAALSQPWRWTFGLALGRYVAQAGPLVMPPVYDADRQGWEVQCAGLWRLFSTKRLMISPLWNGTRLPTASADVVYTNLSLADIARTMIADDLSRPNSSLPIDLPAADGLGGHERNWPSSKLDFVGVRLLELSDVIDGPEIEFAPYLDDQGTQLRWDLRVGRPHLGELTDAWRFSRRTTLVSWSSAEGTTRSADNYFVVGSGADVDLAIGMRLSTRLVTAGYPRLDDLDTTHMQTSSKSTLDAYASQNNSRYLDGSDIAQAVCRIDGRGPLGEETSSPRLDQIRLGDIGTFYPWEHDELSRSVAYRGRIIGATPIDEDNVSLAVQIIGEVIL
jgi:hypothetical protein